MVQVSCSLWEGSPTVQVVQAAEKLPHNRSPHWLELTPAVVAQWARLQQMLFFHAVSLTGHAAGQTGCPVRNFGLGRSVALF